MLSRLHVIREFVGRHLGGIADQSNITVETNDTADHAAVTLTIGERRYGLSVKSSTMVPPLGEIIFTDRQDGEAIRGEVRDHVWKEIAAHIRAAANPVQAVPPAGAAVLPLEPPAPPAVVLPPDGRWPTIGTPVVYTPHPSQARGGVTDMAGQVTKVYPDGRVALTVFPYGGDILSLDRLPRRQTDKDVACWDYLPDSDVGALVAALVELRELVVPSVTPAAPKKAAKG